MFEIEVSTFNFQLNCISLFCQSRCEDNSGVVYRAKKLESKLGLPCMKSHQVVLSLFSTSCDWTQDNFIFEKTYLSFGVQYLHTIYRDLKLHFRSLLPLWLLDVPLKLRKQKWFSTCSGSIYQGKSRLSRRCSPFLKAAGEQ